MRLTIPILDALANLTIKADLLSEASCAAGLYITRLFLVTVSLRPLRATVSFLHWGRNIMWLVLHAAVSPHQFGRGRLHSVVMDTD